MKRHLSLMSLHTKMPTLKEKIFGLKLAFSYEETSTKDSTCGLKKKIKLNLKFLKGIGRYFFESLFTRCWVRSEIFFDQVVFPTCLISQDIKVWSFLSLLKYICVILSRYSTRKIGYRNYSVSLDDIRVDWIIFDIRFFLSNICLIELKLHCV